MPAVTRLYIKMSAENFQREYSELKATALAFFPSDEDKSAREDFIADARQVLIYKYNLLPQNNNNIHGSDVNTRPRNIVKDFISTCPKFDAHNESIIDFFDRFENALRHQKVSDDKKCTVIGSSYTR